MKNKYFKLFLSLLVLLLFTNKVNASLVCGDTTIEETSITDAGFDAVMPICEFKKDEGKFGKVGGTYSTYAEAYAAGTETDRVNRLSRDGKSYDTIEIPICAKEEDRRVSAKVTCTHTYTSKKIDLYDYHTCNEYSSESTCPSGCHWNGVIEKCIGNKVTPVYAGSYYECDAGYEPTGRLPDSHDCVKKKEYPFGYDEIDASTDVVAKAKEQFATEGATCTAEFYLECQQYHCDTKYETISACTPDFRIKDNIPAYCVNPSQDFSHGTNNYQYDNTFNVADCESSYSTVDCGYANILIEGAYYSTSDDAINTALRLWTAHTGQDTNNRPGIASVTGSGCTDAGYKFFMNVGGKAVNIYERTYHYIMYTMKSKFYDVARTHTHIPDETDAFSHGHLDGSTFETIKCLDTPANTAYSMRGIMCGELPHDYRVGFELFFNTLIGNKYMKEHLSTLIPGGEGVKPIAAIVTNEYTLEERAVAPVSETWIQVKFDHEAIWNYVEDERIFCDNTSLEDMRDSLIDKYNRMTAEQKAKTGYSTAEAYADAQLKGSTTLNKIKAEMKEQYNRMSSTAKAATGYSTADEYAEAVLSQIRPYCEVHVGVVDQDGNEVLPSEQVDVCEKGRGCFVYEEEFSVCDRDDLLEKDLEIKVTYERSSVGYSIRKYYACGPADEFQSMFAYFGGDGETRSTETRDEQTFAITNYKCSGGCDNDEVRVPENYGSCKDDTNNYNGYYETEIKDPSLSCIVNLNDDGLKEKFDYSEYFNVNTNFCRVYCSDEIKFVVADKVKAISGRTFSYDIEPAYMKTDKLKYKLISTIEEKRNCVSEIYYNRIPDVNVFKTAYGLTNDEMRDLKSTKTFAGLFKILKAKSGTVTLEDGTTVGENNRNDLLNQIIYDIYNCNFYSESQIKSAGVEIAENYKSPARTKIDKVYREDNNYGLGSDREGNKTDAKSTDVVKYGFGALTIDDSGRINNVSSSTKYTGEKSAISYCKNKTGFICYDYNSEDDEGSYNYPVNAAGTPKTYTLHGGKNIDVPTNDYARFTITARINYYNPNKYQSEQGTGKIYRGYDKEDLLKVPEYSYPIDKNAYNLAECNKTIENGKYHRCTIKQVISPLTFYRNNLVGNLNVPDNTFTCYVDVEKPYCDPSKESCTQAILYRNVNPSNLFPSNNLQTNSNWATVTGQQVRNAIETTADEFKLDESYLDYSITLTPNQIKNIKSYNKNNNGYFEELLDTCSKNEAEGYYYDCHSEFMNKLRDSSSQYANGEYGNLTVDEKNR